MCDVFRSRYGGPRQFLNRRYTNNEQLRTFTEQLALVFSAIRQPLSTIRFVLNAFLFLPANRHTCLIGYRSRRAAVGTSLK